jgi:hypothetical protein
VCLHSDIIKIGVLYVKHSENPMLISYFNIILPCSNAYVFVPFQTLKYVEHNGALLCPPGVREVAEIDVTFMFLCGLEYNLLYNKIYYKSSQCAHCKDSSCKSCI